MRSVSSTASLDQPLRLIVQSELVANEPTQRRSGDPRVAAVLENPLAAPDQDLHHRWAVLLHRPRRSGLRLAAGMDHLVEAPGEPSAAADDRARTSFVCTLAPGQRLRIVKLLAYGVVQPPIHGGAARPGRGRADRRPAHRPGGAARRAAGRTRLRCVGAAADHGRRARDPVAKVAPMTSERSQPATRSWSDELRQPLPARWPTLAGLLTVPVLLLIGLFDDFVEGVVVAAVLYLAWGVLRRRPGQGRWVAWQVPGVLLYGAITFWALSLDHPQLQYALAVGWLLHAAWDVVHFRADRVVPRWWSEWCIALDVLLAVVLFLDP
jgi:hypothetical protein